MESPDRPYVDPATEPGDAGTEPWSDDREPEAGDQTKPRKAPEPAAPDQQGDAADGSPADEFLTDDDAVPAQTDDPDQPA